MRPVALDEGGERHSAVAGEEVSRGTICDLCPVIGLPEVVISMDNRRAPPSRMGDKEDVGMRILE